MRGELKGPARANGGRASLSNVENYHLPNRKDKDIAFHIGK